MNIGAADISSTDGDNINFIVGFKDSLCSTYWCTTTKDSGYSESLIKTVEDNIYNAISTPIKQILKQFSVTEPYKGGSTTVNRFLCSPSKLEAYSSQGAMALFEYYRISSNLIKMRSGTAVAWWTRTKAVGEDPQAFTTSGFPRTYSGISNNLGVSPFGCI